MWVGVVEEDGPQGVFSFSMNWHKSHTVQGSLEGKEVSR